MPTVTAAKPPPRPVSKALFVDSTPLLADPAALRQRAAADGYLFFKRFLPADDVMEMRAQILAVTDKYGWRLPGQDRFGGLLDRAVTDAIPDEDVGVWGTGVPCYRDVQRLEAFHRFPHHPRLLALYRSLFQEEVLVHPRNIARILVPHRNNFPTPPHQDFPYIQGAANTWTCWIPLGDCPRQLGGLTILRGSHHAGYMPMRRAKGAGGYAVQLCAWETEWMEGDYEAGDIITFNSLLVHKALRSRMPDRIRLSLDVRYQAMSEPVEKGSLGPHLPNLPWEDIYRDWPTDELKYYWKKLPLQLSSWDDTVFQPKRRIC